MDASAKSDAKADSADKVQAAKDGAASDEVKNAGADEARTAALQIVALLAANDDHTNKVHVIAENTTYKKPMALHGMARW